MNHESQHVAAIAKTVNVKEEVTAALFNDKVKEMGFVKVSRGQISITLDAGVPSMMTPEAQRDFIVDAISLALRACFDARPSAFEPF